MPPSNENISFSQIPVDLFGWPWETNKQTKMRLFHDDD